MPFFSIVMPVLNRAHLVAGTIASLTAQRFDDFEILLADGGSKDDTRDVALAASSKVRVIEQPKDRPGIGAARSIAFEQANSEYIACLDSDDFMFPWGLSTYKAAIDKFNKPSFMLADGFMFRGHDKLAGNVERDPVFKHYPDYFSFLREPRRGWSLASGSVFRTEYAREIAGQSDKIIYAEDSDMFLRLGDKPGFVRVEAPLTFGYHQHDQNVSINFDRFLKGMHQLIAEENAGGYPGGEARAKERRNELTTLLRSAARRCLNRRRWGDGWELYRKTVKWNAQVGKWSFVAGYPAMMAITPLRPKKKKKPAHHAPAPTSTGQLTREEAEAEAETTQVQDHMPISIVIPAHNEASVIGRCLTTMLRGADSGELEIVVVANGCKDNTAEIARSVSPDVKVIETATPGKSNAINLGDAAATGFPRFYVDADIMLEISAIRRVAQVLRGQSFLAAAPKVKFDLSQRNWFVRAFYDIWQRTPYIAEGMIGSGVYAVSEKGRQRWDKIPGITADDAFVRLQFKPEERTVVADCSFTINPPTSLAGLVKIKTRGHFGNIELKRVQPELFHNEGQSHGRALPKMATNPLLWPKLAVYLYVRVMSRRAAEKRLQQGDHKTWERDDSSRGVPAQAAK